MITTTVRDVLGNQREAKLYPDGSRHCAFCSYAVPPQSECRNPACVANPEMTVQTARGIYAERERKRKEEEDRKRDHMLKSKAEKVRNREKMKAQQEWEQEQIATATAKGACLNCLFRSGEVKFIRHRGRCPKERAA